MVVTASISIALPEIFYLYHRHSDHDGVPGLDLKIASQDLIIHSNLNKRQTSDEEVWLSEVRYPKEKKQ